LDIAHTLRYYEKIDDKKYQRNTIFGVHRFLIQKKRVDWGWFIVRLKETGMPSGK